MAAFERAPAGAYPLPPQAVSVAACSLGQKAQDAQGLRASRTMNGPQARCPLPATPMEHLLWARLPLRAVLGPLSQGMGEVTPTSTHPTVEETEAESFGN